MARSIGAANWLRLVGLLVLLAGCDEKPTVIREQHLFVRPELQLDTQIYDAFEVVGKIQAGYMAEIARSVSGIDAEVWNASCNKYGSLLNCEAIESSWFDKSIQTNPPMVLLRGRKVITGELAAVVDAAKLSNRTKAVTGKIYQQLENIPAYISRPSFLNYGEPTELVLILASANSNDAVAGVDSELGEIDKLTVRVGEQAMARLAAPADFVEIKLRGGDGAARKDITAIENSEWRWDLKAIGEAEIILRLDLITYVRIKNQELAIELNNEWTVTLPVRTDLMDKASIFVAKLGPQVTFTQSVLGLMSAYGVITLFGWLGRAAWNWRDRKSS